MGTVRSMRYTNENSNLVKGQSSNSAKEKMELKMSWKRRKENFNLGKEMVMTRRKKRENSNLGREMTKMILMK